MDSIIEWNSVELLDSRCRTSGSKSAGRAQCSFALYETEMLLKTPKYLKVISYIAPAFTVSKILKFLIFYLAKVGQAH